MSRLYDLLELIISKVNPTVRTIPQSLSDSEKLQARKNIGIVGTGKDGHTPVKYVDYYTDEDKAEMVNAVLAALPVYNGEVESV